MELDEVQGYGGPLNFGRAEIGVRGAGDTHICGGTEVGTWSHHFPSCMPSLLCQRRLSTRVSGSLSCLHSMNLIQAD